MPDCDTRRPSESDPRAPTAGAMPGADVGADLASGRGGAPPPRCISDDGRPPRPNLPTLSKNRRRAFVVPPPRSAANPPGGVVRRQESLPGGIHHHALFHAAATARFPHPRGSQSFTDVATTNLPPQRGCQSFIEPFGHAWDTRSTASTPPFSYEAAVDEDYSPIRNPVLDWSLTPTTDKATQDPICSQGFMDLMTQDVEPDVEVLPTPGSGGKGASKRGSNYNHDEDIQVCESWINVTQDPIVGNEQPSKAYWKRIMDHYNENKTTNMHERTASSLEHRWGFIQKECMKFQGYFEEVERRHRSGIPYKEHLMEAQARYSRNDPKGKACPLIHCWLKVRHTEKFMSLNEAMKQQKKPSKPTAPPEGEEEGHAPASVPPPKRDRPPGRKQSKEKLKRHEGSDDYMQVWGSFLEMKTEEKKQRELRWNKSEMLEERRLDIEERRLQWEQEQRIMFCDVSTMDDSQRAYVLAMRAEIVSAKVASVNAKMASVDGGNGSYAGEHGSASDGADFSYV